MGYVDLDGTVEQGATSHGRTPAWCWAVLAGVWVGIVAACLNLHLRVNDLNRDIARLERQREHATGARREAARANDPGVRFVPVYPEGNN